MTTFEPGGEAAASPAASPSPSPSFSAASAAASTASSAAASPAVAPGPAATVSSSVRRSSLGAAFSAVPRPAGWSSPASGPVEDEVPLREYLRVLRARRWTIVGTVLLVVLVTAVVTFAMTPIYRATSLLLIEPRSPNVAGVKAIYDPVTVGMNLQDYYRTQFEILRSRRVAGPVAAALQVRERPEFAEGRDPIAAFLDTVQVDPIRDSRLVRVSVDSPDKAFAAAAANALVKTYIDQNRQRGLGISDDGLQKLRGMERTLRPSYEQAMGALQAFKEQSGIRSLDETQQVVVQQLKLVSEELSRARVDRAKVVAEVEMARDAVRSGASWSAIPEVSESSVVQQLKLELSKLEAERDDLLRRYKAAHPQVGAVSARVASVKARLDAESRALVGALENRLRSASGRERELRAALTEAEQEVDALSKKGVRLQLLKERADRLGESYQRVTRRIEEVEVSVATGERQGNASVVDRALVPTRPARPRKVLNLALGGVLGVLLGVGLAFLFEHLDDTIKGKEDAEEILGCPVLGFCPRVEEGAVAAAVAKRAAHTPAAGSPAGTSGHNGDGANRKKDGRPPLPRAPALELLPLLAPRSALAEGFRTIRTGLGFTLPSGAPRVVLVTSPSAADGKTLTAVNLAVAVAQTGARVLLIDADFRRPRLRAVFALDDGVDGVLTAGKVPPGLSTVLAAGGEPGLRAVRRTCCKGLDVLPSGPMPPNPSELLGQPAMGALIERALGAYDWVVLDTPPVGAVADAAVLLRWVPNVVLVVRSWSTSRRVASLARETLAQAPARVAGVVLNAVDVPAGSGSEAYGGVGRYSYGYGYGYGPDSDGEHGSASGGARWRGVGRRRKALAREG